jgi:AcrR family transcriptional regulator
MIQNIQIQLNEHLYLKDPMQSELGKAMLNKSVELIYEIGFEEFTFKKLSVTIPTTEATIYRYFENKHRLLQYLTNWYWSAMTIEYKYLTNNIKLPEDSINTGIALMINPTKFMPQHPMLSIEKLFGIIINESTKSYLTHTIDEDNILKLFKPYKDFCNLLASAFLAYAPKFPFAHSLASTCVESILHQSYFMKHLPSLSDCKSLSGAKGLQTFIQQLIFNTLDNNK